MAEDRTRLLLEVWRELCRHLAVDQSIGTLGRILSRHVPFHRLLLRRYDAEAGRIETLGLVGPALQVTRTTVEASDRELLVGWGLLGEVTEWARGPRDRLGRILLPEGGEGAFLAGPLKDRDLLGVVVVEGAPSAARPLLQDLLDPLAHALHNDSRLQELARLREAALADNRALLSRLQREDISESVVGGESGLRGVMERVDRVAPTEAPVLILGETGSGKEVVARQIHVRSRRASGPFLRVNCGAIPAELVDSELFGHERGAFTGAVGTRRGWFERADGGTLFLDELGELPPAAQVRLLRVLQDGTFERVGGQRAMSVDVRIVAATHRDLRSWVDEGRFREDLWYRLSVFPIELPPLRARRGDIPALAAHFAARAGLRLHGVPLQPTAAEIEQLVNYDWPGNVRELAAVIERGAILGNGHRLAIEAALGILPRKATPGPAPARESVPTLESANRQTITEALERTQGRIEGPFGAARLLGINPHTLRSRMRRLGIDWARFRGSESE